MRLVDDVLWWLFKRSGCARYLLRKLYTEFLYDLELAQHDYEGVKARWQERLKKIVERMRAATS